MKTGRMPILSRLRRRRMRDDGSAGAVPADGSGSFAFVAEIPGTSAAKPWWRIAVEMHSAPQGDGEQVRVRVHWQANLASALALEAPRPAANRGDPGAGTAVAERVGDWLRAGLSRPLLRRLAEPLLRHDFNSWVEVRASSADLADANAALLPERARLAALGVELPPGDGPLAQTWAGAAPGPRPGFAQLSLLRLDKRHLPAALAALLGARPFQLAAAVVNVVEEQPPKS